MSDNFTPPGGANGDDKFKKPRDVDQLAGNVHSWWSRTFVFIKKKNVKTWKAVFIIAFVAGVAAATVWTVALKIEQLTKAAGETASLSLVADRNSINVGEDTNIDIVLNGNNNPVVAVKAVVRYNAQDFSLQSWDVSQGAFASTANPCQTSGRACEIISNAATCSTSPNCNITSASQANGTIVITVARPRPGISTTSGVIGTLRFRGLRAVASTTPNITLLYSALRSYDDSDVIIYDTPGRTPDTDVLTDRRGQDILNSVTGTAINVGSAAPPACTSYTYNTWGTCQNGTQTRTVQSSTPTGCEGGVAPVLSQSCTPTPTTCTTFTYSVWTPTTCPSSGTQTRTITSSSPAGCTGGTPGAVSQTCTYTPPTCTFTYSAWTPTTCPSNGFQTRTLVDSTPAGCVGGTMGALSQTCTPAGGGSGTTCTSFNYSAWSPTACPSSGTQTRTVTSSSPAGCTGGTPGALTQSCTYTPLTCTSFSYSAWTPTTCPSYGIQNRSVTGGSPAGCTGGTPGALSQTCTYSRPQACISYAYSSWGSCKSSNTQTRTVISSSPAGCTGGTGPLLTQSCTYKKSDHKAKRHHKKKSSDKIKPVFKAMPSFLYKNRGDKIWWMATDNKGVKNYTYNFNGRTNRTIAPWFNVPVGVSRGPHLLTIRAYDRAGNMQRRYVTIWVK